MNTPLETARRAIRSWIAVEVFCPTITKNWADFAADKLGGKAVQKHELDGTEFQWGSPNPQSPTPWALDGTRQPDTAARSRAGTTEQSPPAWYVVILGAIPAKPAFERISTAFANTADGSGDERQSPTGFVIGAAMVLNEEGKAAVVVPALASFAWGLGQLLRQGPSADFAAWDKVEQSLAPYFRDMVAPLDSAGTCRPLTWADLYEISTAVSAEFGLDDDLWIKVPYVLKLARKFAPEPELLSGFYLNDLITVLKDLDRLPRAAAQYLQLVPPPESWDPLTDRGRLKELLNPARYPLGRWPGPGLHPLTLLQQAAVNHIATDLQVEGIAPVNGPPGTGKTTLLRDLVAHVLTERAAKLATIRTPSEGRGMHGLLDFGILVASSNNAAVENISTELPVREKALDPSIWKAGRLDFFGGTATEALNLTDKEAEEKKAWGLIAARLGNRKNINDFVSRAWEGQEWGLKGWFIDTAFPPGPESKRPPRGALHRICPPPSPASAQAAWLAARSAYREAHAKCLRLRQELAQHADDIERHRELSARYTAEKSALNAALADHTTLLERETTLDGEEQALRATHDAAKPLIATVLSTKPIFWHKLFNTKKWRIYEEQVSKALQRLNDAETAWQHKVHELNKVRAALPTTAAKVEDLRLAVEGTVAAGKIIGARIGTAVSRWGTALPGADLWEKQHEDFHCSSPWNGGEFKAARDELFVASIRLHQAFIAAAAKPMNDAMDKVVAELRGGAANREKPTADDWGLFFVLVPVISTTFASCSRMLRTIGPGQIGWLMVDEAGQASPQHALGAIWRSKRAAIIGDPLQIEPVVTLPAKIIDQLFLNNGVAPEDWVAPMESAQTLADRASSAQGRFMLGQGGDGGQRITGFPLLVHRRCDEPMFSISNRIAYADQMVHAAPAGPSLIRDVLGQSAWVDVEGASEDKWVAAEGDLINQVVGALFQRLGQTPDIYVICPFRAPAYRLRNVIARNPAVLPGLSAPKRWEWLNERIGTVHTFQGKEAEAVILMLGAGRGAKPGSRVWAGSTPNILNVACTRAKRVLYVVGDRHLWEGAGVFQEAALALPTITAGEWSKALRASRVGAQARVT